MSKLRVLYIDDNPLALELFEQVAPSSLGAVVDTAHTAGEALDLAHRKLYDFVLCDAKMPYHHSPLGGILLAEELARRFGRDSVLLISRYLDQNSGIGREIRLPFLARTNSISEVDFLTRAVVAKMREMKKRQFAFVAMPFGVSAIDSLYYKTIKRACRRAGHTPIRVDEDPTNDAIVGKIMNMIETAHFVIFVATKSNPNVFYEAGYARALRKEILMCAPTFGDLPFDVRSNVCLAYEGREDVFEGELYSALARLREEGAGRLPSGDVR